MRDYGLPNYRVCHYAENLYDLHLPQLVQLHYRYLNLVEHFVVQLLLVLLVLPWHDVLLFQLFVRLILLLFVLLFLYLLVLLFLCLLVLPLHGVLLILPLFALI
jgi:hypothetical protein